MENKVLMNFRLQKYLINILLLLSFTTLSMSDAFSFGVFASFSFITIFLASLIYLTNFKIQIDLYDKLLMSFILIGFIDFIVYINFYNDVLDVPQKYLRTWVLSSLVYFFFFKKIIEFYKIDLYKVSKYSYYGIMIAVIYGLFDVIMAINGIFLDELLPRLFGKGVPYHYLIGLWRIRSFTQEPANLIYLLVCLYPIAYIYISSFSPMKKLITNFLIFLVLVGTFSAAGFAFLLLSIFFTYMFYLIKGQLKLIMSGVITKYYLFNFLIFIIFIISLISFIMYTIDIPAFEPLYDRFNPDSQLSSVTDRQFRLTESILFLKTYLDNIYLFLFGMGFGSISDQTGQTSLNFYLDIFADVGLLGSLIFLTFIFLIFRRVLLIQTFKYLFMIAYLYSLMHLAVAPMNKLPYMWFLWAFIILYSKKGKFI